MKKTSNVREIALTTLVTIEKRQAYSQLLLNDMIEKSNLSEKDIPLLTQLVYGVTQRLNSLDFYLAPFIKKKKQGMQDWVLMLLRISLYQKIYLDKIPDHAIINEAVVIAKRRGHRGIANFVNAVLRNIQRTGLPEIDDIKDPVKRISIKESHPEWLVERWIQSYGEAVTQQICRANNKPPYVTARVNRLKIDRESLIEKLEDEGVIAEPGRLSRDALIIKKGILPKTKAFKEGYVTIQDESSMLVAEAVSPKAGMTILDACAGPGGKVTHLAEKSANQGEIIALDLHKHKIKLIDDQAKRLGITMITTKVLDARKSGEQFKEQSFDRILVDAPCTGFGVIRRKPDIKWSKSAKDIEAISQIQSDILETMAALVKKGGRLVYSTCTIGKEENQHIVQKFLKSHPNYEIDVSYHSRMSEEVVENCLLPDGTLQVLPHHFHTDGFYIAVLVKKD